MPNLYYVNIGGNDSLTYVNLRDNLNLESVQAWNNSSGLDTVDLRGSKNLREAYLENHDIREIYFADSTNAEWGIYLSYNSISTLHIPSGFGYNPWSSGGNISLYANPLSNLTVGSGTNLNYIDLSFCPLNGIVDISSLNVESVYLQYSNGIKNLDFSANNSLRYLHLSQCDSLTSVDLRNKINPQDYRIYDNPQLTSLDLRNVPTINLYYHDFTNNPLLNCISVDNVNLSNLLLNNIDPWCSFSLNCTGLGCMDLNALNYDSLATTDDGSCTYQLTYVPDDNFENYLESNGMGDGIANNDSVRTDNISNVTILDVSNLSIADLTGIKDFNSLVNLDFSNNLLTDLDYRTGTNHLMINIFAYGNPSLTCISVDDSIYSTNTWVQGSNYFVFDLQHYFSNQCPGAPYYGCIDPLANNYNSLADTDDGSCQYNKTYVPDDILEAWFEANGYGDNIAYNDSVLTASINTITYLPLSNKNIYDATGIEAIQSLQDLDIENNNLTRLELSNMPNLYYVNIGGNDSLTYVNLRDNLNLESVQAWNNSSGLDTVDLRGSKNLREAYLENHDIREIYFADSTNAEWGIYLSYNSISTLHIPSGFGYNPWSSGGNISLYANPLSNLTVGSGTNLNYIDLSFCPLNGIVDISSLNVESVYLQYSNGIKNLDFSANNNLRYLHLSQCDSLTSVDLRNKINPQDYRIYDNPQLTSLDLRNVPTINLYYHDFTNNPLLNCISVDNVNLSNLLLNNIDPWCSFSLNCTGLGCMDLNALNYDSLATTDDGSCTYQLTYVPDDNFENYLESNGMGDGIANNDSVRTDNISNVTILDVSNLSIADLTGIKDFNSLVNLDFSNNLLTDLDYRTGTNHLMINIVAYGNPSLTCISVDDSIYSTNTWVQGSNYFVFDLQHYFSNQCPGAPYYGCIDPLANNYNSLADTDDGSCQYNKTYVPDDILEAWFEANGYGDNIAYNDSVLTASINTITYLPLSNKNIYDATGIEAIQSLQDLDIENNNLTRLELSNMPNLYYVNIGGNDSLTYVNLRDNLNLESVQAWNNSSGLDTVDLRGSKNLREAYLENHDIREIYFADSTNAEWGIYLSYNSISTLHIPSGFGYNPWSSGGNISLYANPLSNLTVGSGTNLNYIDLSFCPLNGIVDISSLNVESVYLQYSNGIKNLDFSANNNLRYLHLSQCDSLTSVDLRNKINPQDYRIYDNPQLTSLDLRNSPIVNLSYHDFTNNPLLNCISVSDTLVSNTLLNNIDPWCSFSLNCTGLGCMDPNALNYDPNVNIDDGSCIYQALTYVPDDNFENYLESVGWGDGIANNDSVITSSISQVVNLNISSLNISKLTGIEAFIALKYLYCHFNNIDTLNLSSNTALEFLNAEGNSNLSYLDISQSTSLVDLRLNQCNLNAINITNNPALSILTIGGNNISSIDLSSNSQLTILDCWNNSISSLDLSQNTLLTSINCNSNQISSLDFSNNPNMLNISCNSNQLTSLDVTSLNSLQILWCPGNSITGLDLSQNSQLNTIRCENNDLNLLDVKNGNNSNVTQFFSTGNSNLTCINVDDTTYSNNNWTNIDPQSYFSSNCFTSLPLTLNPVADSLCLGDTVQITWTGGNPNDTIEILLGNNTLWQVHSFVALTANTGSYTWVVSGVPAGPGDDYQFYIQDVPNQNSWDYGSVFAICPIYGCIDPLALNYDQSATVDDGSCIYNLNSSVIIDSVVITNPILCNGNLADIEVFVDNDTSSSFSSPTYIPYQLKAFKVNSFSTFSYFSSSQTTGNSIAANGLDQATYYLLVVDSVSFNSTYNPFSQFFSNSYFINNVLNDPSVYDYDSIIITEPVQLT